MFSMRRERFPPLFKPCPNRIGSIPASSKANFTYRGRFCAYPYINLPPSARLGARSSCLWVTAQGRRCCTRHLSLNRYRQLTALAWLPSGLVCPSSLLNPNAEFHGHRFAGAKVLICRQLLLRPYRGGVVQGFGCAFMRAVAAACVALKLRAWPAIRPKSHAPSPQSPAWLAPQTEGC